MSKAAAHPETKTGLDARKAGCGERGVTCKTSIGQFLFGRGGAGRATTRSRVGKNRKNIDQTQRIKKSGDSIDVNITELGGWMVSGGWAGRESELEGRGAPRGGGEVGHGGRAGWGRAVGGQRPTVAESRAEVKKSRSAAALSVSPRI